MTTPGRLDYIDWMRGLACLLMFQTHVYDSWLREDLRGGQLLMYSQLGGTFPAPLFLFLAGISLAMGVDRMEARGAAPGAVLRAFARRGAEVWALGMLFRVQQYAFAWGWAPWTDLLRVDILNTIGVSLAMAAVVPWAVRSPGARIAAGVAVAAAIALATPPLWTTAKPDFLPWWLASYINGGHTTYQPRGWFFPLFPWAAFTFAGLACGVMLSSARKLGREGWVIVALGVAGPGLVLMSRWLDHSPGQFYAVYDYWRTSPNFFLARVGFLLAILALCYAWCRVKPGKLWSPVTQLGTTSLLVYWVHIELVYGRFNILPKRANTELVTTLGLLAIIASMALLSLLKQRLAARNTRNTDRSVGQASRPVP